VVSDYFALEQLKTVHQVTDSEAAAARAALETGVDVELPDPSCTRARRPGEGEDDPDRGWSIARWRACWRLKFELGLFEEPYVDVAQADVISGSAEHAALARKAAERSIVLVKNAAACCRSTRARADAGRRRPQRRAVPAGRLQRRAQALRRPAARHPRDGGRPGSTWCGRPAAASRAAPTGGRQGRNVFPAEDRKMIDEAVAVAKRAVRRGAGGGRQRADIARGVGAEPPRRSQQPRSVRAAERAGGRGAGAGQADGGRADQRPPAVGERHRAARRPRIVEAFYLGQEGGAALAAALFGDINPGGKLPVSFARSAGHLPVFYNHKPSARRGYLLDGRVTAVGVRARLSYTTFGYKNLKVTPAKVGQAGCWGWRQRDRRRHQRTASAPATKWCSSICATWSARSRGRSKS
jgi:beta-glucosidase